MSKITVEEKVAEVQGLYAHWNCVTGKQFANCSNSDYSSCDCSDIGSDCHGDGECGGDGE